MNVTNAVPGEIVKLFADDTNLFVSSIDVALLNTTANACLKHLNDWCLANRLSLNLDKSCYMTFPSGKNVSNINLRSKWCSEIENQEATG